jgi:ABC-type Mn2+/Zn2+ transport system permease subunit
MSAVLELLLEPMRYEFFRNALLAALMVGVLSGVMGVYIVLRGLSYIGHGLSHAAFGGAVLGYVLRINFYLAATASALLAALVIQRISDGKRVRGDAAIGIVTNAAFAVGVALISLKHRFERSFEAALFGNILGATDLDLVVMACVLVLCVSAIAVFYRDLLFAAFDDETAATAGIATARLWAGFSFLLALAIIASMNIVGVTMIAAALVMPAATARAHRQLSPLGAARARDWRAHQRGWPILELSSERRLRRNDRVVRRRPVRRRLAHARHPNARHGEACTRASARRSGSRPSSSARQGTSACPWRGFGRRLVRKESAPDIVVRNAAISEQGGVQG